MNPFDHFNPWLVVAVVAFASFILGRMSVPESAQSLRYREAARQAELARFADLEPDLQNQIRTLMGRGRKIEAIKLYREATNSGLKDSKELVESLVQS
jgi:ribosomal protein L7/L12